MSAVFLERYGAAREALVVGQTPRPQPEPHEVLVQVRSVGISPLDVDVRQGYGRSVLEINRPLPWIIGQEASGVVAAAGQHVFNYKAGDEVWVSLSPLQAGGYAEYVVASPAELSHKPRTLSHHDAAALPFVTTTVWSALVDMAQLIETANRPHLPPQIVWLAHYAQLFSPVAIASIGRLAGLSSASLNSMATLFSGLAASIPQFASGAVAGYGAPQARKPTPAGPAAGSAAPAAQTVSEPAFSLAGLRVPREKRGAKVLIDGGSGAFGTVAVQLLKRFGFHVTVTCGAANTERMRSLGCDRVLDHSRETVSQIKDEVDVFVDARGGNRSEDDWERDESVAMAALRQGSGHYITLRGPLLRRCDQLGAVQGFGQAIGELLQKKARYQKQGLSYDWCLNQPSHEALAHMTALVDAGVVKPHVDNRVFRGLDGVISAHEQAEAGPSAGKLVVDL